MPDILPIDLDTVMTRTFLLTDAEHEVATILAFDPDASIPAGTLHPVRDDPRTNAFAGSAMSPDAWRKLAKAASCPRTAADDRTLIATFLAGCTSVADIDPAQVINARVRVRPRPRAGVDRYANRVGEVVRPHFAGFYVRLDMTPRERTQKVELVETEHLELLSLARA